MKNLLYTLADPLAKEIYKLTFLLSQKYQFSIGEQLRRSSLSVILNIVEGYARKTDKEKKHFYHISFGSLKETQYLLRFIEELDLLSHEKLSPANQRVEELAKVLYGLLYKSSSK